MRIKIGDLVSDWPYGEPWPNYGIVIDINEPEKTVKVMWVPRGDAFWINAFSVTKIKETDKIQLFS